MGPRRPASRIVAAPRSDSLRPRYSPRTLTDPRSWPCCTSDLE